MKTLAILLITFTLNQFAEAGDTLRNRIRIQKKSQLELESSDDSESFTSEKLAALSVRRRSLIQDIKKFLREARSEDQKTELNLRLGGLYMEDYRSELASAEENFRKQQTEYEKNKKTKKAPKLDNSEANASLDKARAIYRDLAKRFPKHPRRDEMLYFLALSSLDKGYTEEAMRNFRDLANETPHSKYVGESLLQLADHYFDKNSFAEAEGYYNKIIQRKNQQLIPYAVYKKAWCAYNLQRTEPALKQFKWVIENESTAKGVIRLKNEALRDITLPFVDLKLTQESILYFQAQGDPHYRRGLETMAGLYFEQGDHNNAATMYETLLGMDPNYAKNAQYDISIVESLRAKNLKDKAVARLFSRIPVYMENSTWYEINAANPSVVKEASQGFEETARRFALEIHAEGQKTKNEQLYTTAKVLYEKYLEFYPRTTQSAQIRFYLAEIQYRRNEYVPAADNYFTVYKDPMAGKIRFEAIENALNALDHAMNLERKGQGLTAVNAQSTAKLKEAEDAVLEQIPYSTVENKYILVSEEYLSAFPKVKNAADVLYSQAYLQYIHYDFIKAYKAFWQLVQSYPGHVTSYSSAYLILDVLNRKKDYQKMVLASQKFLATKALNKPDFRVEVAKVLRSAELKRIQQTEDRGDYKLAATEYIEYTKEYGPQDPALWEKALYNASINYSKAGLLIEAVETQEQFLRRFSKSALRENMLLQVAKTYEQLANFEKAAYYFELFSSDYPSHTQTKNALRLAGLYHWGGGQPRKAEMAMKRFIQLYPSEAKVVSRDLIDIYEQENAYEKQIDFYLKDRATRGIPISQYVADTLAVAEIIGRRRGQIPSSYMEEALKVSQKFHKDIMSSRKGVESYAKTLFWFANQKDEVFYRIKLALPQRQLEINLQRKLALLKELEKEYSHIATLGGGEWGLGAIYKTASAYRTMAQDVLQAPVPAELSAEQVEHYRAEVGRQMVKPFNEKAMALVAQCLDKAQEFNLMSSWTPKCYGLGTELDSNRYPLVKTFYLPALHVAVMAPSETSKTPIGGLKRYAFPYDSTGIFQDPTDRGLSTLASAGLPLLYDGSQTMSDASRSLPSLLNYRTLAHGRREIIQKALSSERPSDSKKTSFAYLNFLRLYDPRRAVSSIQETIQRDPSNIALHNLLGLAYLDAGNLPAAKVTWLSLIARGERHPSVWNNLGVLSIMEADGATAIEYFTEATNQDTAKESSINLGFLALKYRNGFEAKKQFSRALLINDDEVISQVGMAVAKIQNREFDAAKDGLVNAVKMHKSDPYARLSMAYFSLDIDREPSVTQAVLSDYLTKVSNVENDQLFREAIQDSRRVPGARGTASTDSGALPEIGN